MSSYNYYLKYKYLIEQVLAAIVCSIDLNSGVDKLELT
jgi:hypothetical protein